MQFIDLQAQYLSIKDRIDKRVHAVLDHGKYIYGPEVFELEDKLSDYVGVKSMQLLVLMVLMHFPCL